MFLDALSAVRDLGRLHDIASILIRYGFSDLVRRLGMGNALERAGKVLHWKYAAEAARLEPPQRVRRALEEMGPTFIKLGQILATRVDLFPPEWIAEFEKLHDQVPSLPFEEIRGQLEEDLGAPVDEVFSEFDRTPLAAASIAQVHRGRLDDGRAVIVKIRRPGIRRLIEADLRLLERLARIAENEVVELRRYRPRAIVRQFNLSLRRELDLVSECRSAERMAAGLENVPGVVIPKVYWELSGERVNVQEFIDGIPGRNLRALDDAGLDRKQLAQQGAKAVLTMILVNGFFHADPHPGNIIFLRDNRLAFIDFGMVGRLSEERREEVAGLLYAMVERDANRVVDVLLEWAGDAAVDIRGLTADVDTFIDTYHGIPLKQLKISAMLIELAALIRDHHLVLPPDLTMLFKALLTLEGMGRQINPEFDLVAEAAPFLQQTMLARYRPEAVAKRSWRSFTGMVDLFSGLPDDLRRFMRAIRSGALRFNVDVNQLDRFGEKVDRAASRLTVGMITSALIIGSSIVMTVQAGPTLFGLPAFGLLGYIGAGFCGVWLLFSILRSTRSGYRER